MQLSWLSKASEESERNMDNFILSFLIFCFQLLILMLSLMPHISILEKHYFHSRMPSLSLSSPSTYLLYFSLSFFLWSCIANGILSYLNYITVLLRTPCFHPAGDSAYNTTWLWPKKKGRANGEAYENDIETSDKLNVIRLDGKKRKKQTLGKRKLCCKLHTHTELY